MKSGVEDRASAVPDPESEIAGDGTRAAVDPLSDVLANVRLTGALFFLWETSEPFASPVPPGGSFAATLVPRARQVVSYHVVVEGSCWGSLLGGPPTELRAGDVLLVSRGDAYVMASSRSLCESARVDEVAARAFFSAMAADPGGRVVREGGGGAEGARVVCGFLGCDVGPFNPLLDALPPLLRLESAASPASGRLRSLVEFAIAEAQRPSAGSGCVLTRLGELLFVEVVRRSLGNPAAREAGWIAGLRDPVVARCLARIHARPEHAWTLPELARASATSRSVLARRFAELVGEPPIQYLVRWRIQLGANRLLDSSDTVASIAHRVGFGSPEAFGRAFKKQLGRTPAEFRRVPD